MAVVAVVAVVVVVGGGGDFQRDFFREAVPRANFQSKNKKKTIRKYIIRMVVYKKKKANERRSGLRSNPERLRACPRTGYYFA